tara:strand:+ start:62 stop:487 length:426 start_codon:yes stop_codon:yes gene_type:complete
MRKIYKNFITKKEANVLLKTLGGKIIDSKNKITNKIVDKLKEDFDFKIKPESYYHIEHYPSGHPWHKDTGINNHMSWCQLGVSILLKNSSSGGDTYYAEDIKGTNKIKSDRKLYDLIAHTSDEWHMVEPHEGERVVFLIFI